MKGDPTGRGVRFVGAASAIRRAPRLADGLSVAPERTGPSGQAAEAGKRARRRTGGQRVGERLHHPDNERVGVNRTPTVVV